MVLSLLLDKQPALTGTGREKREVLSSSSQNITTVLKSLQSHVGLPGPKGSPGPQGSPRTACEWLLSLDRNIIIQLYCGIHINSNRFTSIPASAGMIDLTYPDSQDNSRAIANDKNAITLNSNTKNIPNQTQTQNKKDSGTS